MDKINLLIHHHATVFVDPETKEMYTFSFIGRWVNAIAPLVDKLGLLFYTTKVKTDKHDTLLISKNIILESLNEKEKFYHFKKREEKFKQLYAKISDKYNCIIIRGVTPRQYLVGKVFIYPKMFFLLVGSIIDSKPNFKLTISGFHSYFMYFWRIKELTILSKKYTFFANSYKVIDELKDELCVSSKFIPTNTLKFEEIFPFKEKKINSENLTLLFCGRVVADKGVIELLQAFYFLLLENNRHKLIIVGEVNEIFYNQIKSLKYYNLIEKNIEFKGFVKFGIDLLRIYDKSDFYILPSYHEGFPHSIWEAAATCTPILTTNVGGIPSVVNENEVTFIEKKSGKDIYDKINFFINNNSLLNSKSQAIYKKIKENTVEICAKTLIDEIRNS
jgi:glycosyltransferase involved in cell wall biosynthesis